MNKAFKQWSNNLIPVELTPTEDGKKDARPFKWKSGETYTKFPKNSIALRTGQTTVNVIDVDTKDFSKLTEPFKTWVEDRIMFEDTFIVETANGFHFYFNPKTFLLRTTTKTGVNKSPVPFIDFRGEGGLIFVHSTSEIASYSVISDEIPTANVGDIVAYLPPYVDQEVIEDDEEGFENLDDSDDTSKLVPNENGLKNRVELEELLKPIDSATDRDNWMQLMASAYNIAENKADAKEVCLEWSKLGKNFTEKGFDDVWKQIETKRYGRVFKGGTLIKESNENRADERDEKFERYVASVKSAKTVDDIKALFGKKGDWKKQPLCSKAQQTALPAIAKERATAILKEEGSKEKVSVAEFKPLIVMENIKDAPAPLTTDDKKDLKKMQIYLQGRDFLLQYKGKLSDPLGKANLKDTYITWGIKDSVFANAVGKTIPIQSTKRETRYMDERVSYITKPSDNPSELDHLYVYTNPYFGIEEFSGRQDIIEDFFTNIWKGKAEDILRIIGLTIRFEETKLNKIHVVAPSNTGKTTFLENVGFQTIHMKRLIQALNADKGIGKGVVNGLKGSGFLLIDETNEALTQEIKNIDNYVYLDQFGEGGTQEIKLHFTCMTSTHKTAIRGMSDEMYNRLMLVELDDMGYPLENSSLFINENAVYTQTLIDYAKWVIKDALINPIYKKADLHKLQSKYRLELNNDIDEMLTEISEDVITEYKSLATADGVVLERNGDYFVRRKTDLADAIEDRMSEYSNIDKGKYADVLTTHFLGDAKAKNIKINGKSVKYYPLSLKKYYATADAELIDEFDNLDTEFE